MRLLIGVKENVKNKNKKTRRKRYNSLSFKKRRNQLKALILGSLDLFMRRAWLARLTYHMHKLNMMHRKNNTAKILEKVQTFIGDTDGTQTQLKIQALLTACPPNRPS